MDRDQIFGLKELSFRIPELLKVKVKNKNNPDEWVWTPHKPNKIKNIISEIAEEKQATDFAAVTNYKIGKEPQRVVLIFAMGNLTYGLLKKLEERNLKYFYLDFPQFIVSGKILVRIENQKTVKILSIGNLTLDLNDVSTVLWNPPKYPARFVDFTMIPQENGRGEYLFKKRWSQLIKELHLLMNKNVVWLPSNPFNGSQEWQNKLGEYELAKTIGLEIPPIIFTNDKAELKKFSKQHGNELLLREFSVAPFSFPPVLINVDTISLTNFKDSPICFQKYIEKVHEYRTVIVFDKVFPCKIYSQESELTKRDWRIHDDANVKWELSSLPKGIIQKLLKMKKALNLNWCSVDLIYGTDGKYYFLEMNRPGAHYWLDLFVGLDITEHLISEIENRNLIEKTI